MIRGNNPDKYRQLNPESLLRVDEEQGCFGLRASDALPVTRIHLYLSSVELHQRCAISVHLVRLVIHENPSAVFLEGKVDSAIEDAFRRVVALSQFCGGHFYGKRDFG